MPTDFFFQKKNYEKILVKNRPNVVVIVDNGVNNDYYFELKGIIPVGLQKKKKHAKEKRKKNYIF